LENVFIWAGKNTVTDVVTGSFDIDSKWFALAIHLEGEEKKLENKLKVLLHEDSLRY
jgi:hypothetical protein